MRCCPLTSHLLCQASGLTGEQLQYEAVFSVCPQALGMLTVRTHQVTKYLPPAKQTPPVAEFSCLCAYQMVRLFLSSFQSWHEILRPRQ